MRLQEEIFGLRSKLAENYRLVEENTQKGVEIFQCQADISVLLDKLKVLEASALTKTKDESLELEEVLTKHFKESRYLSHTICCKKSLK